MKLTKSGPLIDREIDWLEEVLLKYGNDDSVLCFSELDGFLTAIVSGPNTISPNTGSVLSGGEVITTLAGPLKRDDAFCGAVFSAYERYRWLPL